MNFDGSGNVKLTTLWNKVTNVSPGDTTDSVDMQDGALCEMIVQYGGQVGETITLSLTDSDDDVTFAAVAGVDSITLTTDLEVRTWMVRRGAVRRYLAVQLYKNGATAARAHVIARQSENVADSEYPTIAVV